jgi:streptogramin lyase
LPVPARNWLLSAGFSLVVVNGCIINEPGVSYILPDKKDAGLPNGRGGSGGSRAGAGGAGGDGPSGWGGWGGSVETGGIGGTGGFVGGTGGFGVGGMGGFGTGGDSGGVGGRAGSAVGGTAGAGGFAGARRDAGGASGDADVGTDAHVEAGSVGDTGTDGTGSGAGGNSGAGGTGGGSGGATGTGGGGTGTGGGTGGTGGGGTSVDAGLDASNDSGPDAPTGGSGTIVEFTIPTPNAGAYDIVRGGDGNLWFTEETGNKIARIGMDGVFAEYALPTAAARPRGLTVSGSRIYFTEFSANKIAYLETANPSVITEVPCLAGPTSMTTAVDGTVWYTAVGANEVVKLAANGTAAGHWPTPNGVAGAISFISQGAFWLATTAQGRVDLLNPMTNAMQSMSFVDDALGLPITDIVIDWNADVWLTDGVVLRQYYTDGNQFFAYSAPGSIRSVAPGPIGAPVKNLYMTMPLDNKILVRSGNAFTTHQVPTANSSPYDIVGGADGNLWFTERTGNKIGRFVP